jgi:Na+:H+ antiporter, NhaA family
MNNKIPVVDNPRIRRLLKPAIRFFELQQASGFLLIAVALIALVWANSPFASYYFEIWKTKISIGFGEYKFEKDFLYLINDGIMVVFFFVVGLEIKRELLIGELSSFKNAVLPVVAALGGMIFPALIYYFINGNGLAEKGWGIPMATDIAFAIGILAILGNRVPFSLKVFLTAVAIIDDLGAVIVIAFFYSAHISFVMLGLAGIVLLILIAMNILHVKSPLVYALLGIVLWFFFLQSGVHATIAGVVLAFTIPARTRINGKQFYDETKNALIEMNRKNLVQEGNTISPDVNSILYSIEDYCEKATAPAHRLEHKLHPYVAFFIMPLFALANAGVSIKGFGGGIINKITIGIILGLLLGKAFGISLFSLLTVKFGIGVLPAGSTIKQLIGIGFLAGIGFTMSLFIAGLAFGNSEFLDFAKVGIIAGSFVSALIGYYILKKGSQKY